MLRKRLEENLKNRGRTCFTNGLTAKPPKRWFKTMTEEIIYLLNDSAIPLTTKDISNYLGFEHKSVGKAMRNILLYRNASKYISKIKNGNTVLYDCNIPDGVDVPTIYKLIRHRDNPISESKEEKSISLIPPDIIELVKAGELEIVIRKPIN